MKLTGDRQQGERLGNDTEREIDRLFRAAIRLNGSDLHLRVGLPPAVRLRGKLRALNRGPIDRDEMQQLCLPLMDERLRRVFDETGGADFSYTVECDGRERRFRVNLLRQMGHMGMVARLVNDVIPDFASLNLPPVMEELCKFDQGMILLAGVTGSGKSTTIGSMLNWINARYRKHILTLEDPIEFVFRPEKCYINQREIGVDVKDFETGMKHAVREDPDIILVGEMRDRETFSTAIHAAETGHLVFGTIHASSAPTTIGRILDLFPADMHSSMRSSLAFNMKGIIAQKLLPSVKEGVSRVPAVEVMTFSPMVRKLIMEGKDEKLADVIRMSEQEGMRDFTQALKDLVDRGFIRHDVALEVAPNPHALEMALKGISVAQAGIL